MGKPRSRPRTREYSRRGKKKVSIITTERLAYVDYKDVNLLRRFMSDRAKIRARKVTGNNAQQQRVVARAIKIAREMALLPYASRGTTQRGAGRPRYGEDEPMQPQPGEEGEDGRHTQPAEEQPIPAQELDEPTGGEEEVGSEETPPPPSSEPTPSSSEPTPPQTSA